MPLEEGNCLLDCLLIQHHLLHILDQTHMRRVYLHWFESLPRKIKHISHLRGKRGNLQVQSTHAWDLSSLDTHIPCVPSDWEDWTSTMMNQCPNCQSQSPWSSQLWLFTAAMVYCWSLAAAIQTTTATTMNQSLAGGLRWQWWPRVDSPAPLQLS